MFRLRISSESDVTRSLIAASRFAQDLGFPRQDCQSISTAVSELSRNILKYAGNGEIIIEKAEADGRTAVQITAGDRGPGIEDLEVAMRDHFSSSGTLGLGLPGVRRMMDDFEIDSTPGKGTRVVVRKWRELPSKPIRSVLREAATRGSLQRRRGESSEGALPREVATHETSVDCAFLVRPYRGERVSGDIAVIDRKEGQVFLAIIDGLGHGPTAHRIAQRAADFLKQSWKSDLALTMRELHATLRGTDGAAAGLCLVDVATHTARYVGVGNTVVRVLGGSDKGAYSTPGTLGHQIRTPREQCLAIRSGEVLVLYTDGVKEQFELQDYPQLRLQDARMIVRTIITRYGKDHDDASCIALRYQT